ncbi:MAG: hydrolase [Frankiales bacterium]|nr:hydrolase [Frankiales bacterium]
MPHEYEVVESETVYEGRVIDVRRDIVAMPGDTTSQRDVVEHPGAVAILALRGDPAEVLLVNQYRHPAGRHLDELPAGLLDKAGEKGIEAAKRELVEEAGFAAETWHVLVDLLSSPGMTDESIRIYLARDLSPVTRDVQEHEELEMTSRWLPLTDALDRVLRGDLENATAVVGVLAAAEAVRRGLIGLRGTDAPWTARPHAQSP